MHKNHVKPFFGLKMCGQVDVDKVFQRSDLVNAKVKGYPYWPAIILHSDDECRVEGDLPACISNSELVFFFGDNTVFYVNRDFSKLIEGTKIKLTKHCGMQNALHHMNLYLE